METQTILFIAVAFCLGCAFAWVLARRGAKSDAQNEALSKLQSTNSDLQNQVETLRQKNESITGKLSETEKAAQEMLHEKEQALKSEYDSLLQQIISVH